MNGMLPLWGALGETTVESQFSDFYRTRLQRVPGARVPAKELLAAHTVWAATSGAATISFKEAKRLMVRAGHRHFYSNGAQYGDVLILSDGAAIVMDAARARAEKTAATAVIERLDRAMAELAELRALFAEVRR